MLSALLTPEFSSQHEPHGAYNILYHQFQGTQCLLLFTSDTCIYMHIYKHTHIYTKSSHTQAHTHIHFYTCTHMYICISVYTQIHRYMKATLKQSQYSSFRADYLGAFEYMRQVAHAKVLKAFIQPLFSNKACLWLCCLVLLKGHMLWENLSHQISWHIQSGISFDFSLPNPGTALL